MRGTGTPVTRRKEVLQCLQNSSSDIVAGMPAFLVQHKKAGRIMRESSDLVMEASFGFKK
ncbi:hypothetical protein E4U16_002050 [Claviceps sp. LM84 group G4]|nr:hypothetical protein E4U33_004778 [Claviceps sp. LM78 group G4]KAG6077716.1 hypothetical protein E4U16_002050 [Claviceps sp. LM84 group G4]